ncbi:MAG: nucleotidyltransferase domain-containing protein [Caldilineaceae bacterium]|nr:nucleotidyltransferase domain-containing protein [Caldilineaceae bacterium]
MTLDSMTDILANLPEPKRLLLDQLVAQLSQIPGMAAIVLGGSYASGAQHAQSDMDIGLYYDEASPFAVDDIRRVAEGIAVDGAVTVTDFYEWGAWVNGGAWIGASAGKVDFLYRNLAQVQRTISQAQQGIVHHDYDQQPTYGFYSVIYLAETAICKPLFDPTGQIVALKQQVALYPPQLKKQIVAGSLWAAEFSLLFARNFAAQGDVYNTVGCLTRVASNLTQALFALNETYFMRDKKVMETIGAFPILPAGYVQTLNGILAHPGSTASALTKATDELTKVWTAVTQLGETRYEPRFKI